MKFSLKMSQQPLKPYVDPALSYLLRRLHRYHAASYAHTLIAAQLALLFTDTTHMKDADKRSFIRSVLAHDLGIVHLSRGAIEQMLTDGTAWKQYELHPIRSWQIVSQFGIPDISKEMVLYHHEFLNGHGYPFGCKWDKLSYEVRVLAVIDAFADILYEHNPHAGTLEDRMEELYVWSDIRYDKDILDHFTTLVPYWFGGRTQKR